MDPALRRPGRFDREMAFALPGSEERTAISRATHGTRVQLKAGEMCATKFKGTIWEEHGVKHMYSTL